MDGYNEHPITALIHDLRMDLEKNADSAEDARTKALVKTKLQEAELWSTLLYPIQPAK